MKLVMRSTPFCYRIFAENKKIPGFPIVKKGKIFENLGNFIFDIFIAVPIINEPRIC
jgi:hypothetical protein